MKASEAFALRASTRAIMLLRKFRDFISGFNADAGILLVFAMAALIPRRYRSSGYPLNSLAIIVMVGSEQPSMSRPGLDCPLVIVNLRYASLRLFTLSVLYKASLMYSSVKGCLRQIERADLNSLIT